MTNTGTGIYLAKIGMSRQPLGSMEYEAVREGDGSLYAPAIHITDPQHSRIVMTIPGGYFGASLQVVVCDTLAVSSTVWAACSENGTIRNYALYGEHAGLEIAADRIVMSDLGVSAFNPNALAFDPSRGTGRGALWVGGNDGTSVYCIDADPAAATRILSTITLAHNPTTSSLSTGDCFTSTERMECGQTSGCLTLQQTQKCRSGDL